MNADVYGTMWGPTEFSCAGNLSDLNLEDLGDFRGPILLTCGAHDEVDEGYLRELAARWPDTRIHVFPESSHSVPLEEPDALLSVARQFFRRLTS